MQLTLLKSRCHSLGLHILYMGLSYVFILICVYISLLLIRDKNYGFGWCFENVNWQSFMIGGLKTPQLKETYINSGSSLYICCTWQYRRCIFIYAYFCRERDEDVWCRHSKGILWQGFQHSVVGSGLKFTELHTIIHVYMCNQNKRLKGPWQRTGTLLVGLT